MGAVINAAAYEKSITNMEVLILHRESIASRMIRWQKVNKKKDMQEQIDAMSKEISRLHLVCDDMKRKLYTHNAQQSLSPAEREILSGYAELI